MLNNSPTQKFKNGIIRNYGRNSCLITGYQTCEAIHLIPRSICRKYVQFQKHENNPFNGLLITNTLHYEYDHYFWTFDINDQEGTEGDWVELSIAVKPGESNLMIRQFLPGKSEQKPRFRIHKRSIPFLYLRYQVWLNWNFLSPPKSPCYQFKDEPELFYSFFRITQIGQSLSKDQSIFVNDIGSIEFRDQTNQWVIINHRKFSTKNQYQLVNRDLPFHWDRWASEEDLDSDLLELYWNRFEIADDPDFQPKPSKTSVNRSPPVTRKRGRKTSREAERKRRKV